MLEARETSVNPHPSFLWQSQLWFSLNLAESPDRNAYGRVRRRVRHFAIEQCHQALQVLDLAGRNGVEVAIPDGDVGFLPDLNRTDLIFQEHLSRPKRCSCEGRCECPRLLTFRRDAVNLERLICWCLIVIVPLSAWPQSQPAQPAGVEDHKEKLSQGERACKFKTQVQERGTGEKATVKITLRDKSEVKGYISQINADSFQVTDKKTGKISTVTYDAVERVRGGGFVPGCKDRNLGRGGCRCGHRAGVNGSHTKPFISWLLRGLRRG